MMPLKKRQSPAFENAMNRITKIAETAGRRDEIADQKFRRAVGATSLEWLDAMSEKQRKDVLLTLMVAAKAGDRRQIAQHADCDEALLERVDAELARRAAEAEAKAEAERLAKLAAAGSETA